MHSALEGEPAISPSGRMRGLRKPKARPSIVVNLSGEQTTHRPCEKLQARELEGVLLTHGELWDDDEAEVHDE